MPFQRSGLPVDRSSNSRIVVIYKNNQQQALAGNDINQRMHEDTP